VIRRYIFLGFADPHASSLRSCELVSSAIRVGRKPGDADATLSRQTVGALLASFDFLSRLLCMQYVNPETHQVRNPTFDKAGMAGAGFLQATKLAKLAGPLNDWQNFFCSEFVGAALRVAQIPELSEVHFFFSLSFPDKHKKHSFSGQSSHSTSSIYLQRHSPHSHSLL